MDERTLASIKWGVIAGAVLGIISGVASFVAFKLFTVAPAGGPLGELIALGVRAQRYGFGNFISSILWSSVGGAIGGLLLSLLFPFWLQLYRAIFGRLFRANNLFQLYFYSGLVGWLFFIVLGGLLSGAAFGGIAFWLINAVGSIIAIYAFATIMESGVGKYYDSIINSGGAQ